MSNFQDVATCASRFTEAVKMLRQFREHLRNETYLHDQRTGNDQTNWFVVTDGAKPWWFDVDWLGTTYRIQLGVELEVPPTRMAIKQITITIGRVGDGMDPRIDPISSATVKRGQILFTCEGREIYSTCQEYDSATLFFAMIGHVI